MRLALKFTLALVLGVVLLAATYDWFSVADQIRELEARITDDLGLVARGLSVALPDLAQAAGEPAAQRLIAQRNQEGAARVRWVSLDAPTGSDRFAALSEKERVELAREGSLVVTRTDSRGASTLFVYRTFRTAAPVSGVVEISESLAPLRARTQRALYASTAKSVAILILSSLYALVLGVRLVGRPIDDLVAQARRIGAGDLSRRISTGRRDEIAQLAAEMNLMSDHIAFARDRLAAETTARVSAIEQLRHADRLKTVGQLASGIAHELGTPLNVVAAHAKIIATGDATLDEMKDGARVIAEQAGRITTIVRQLLDFARRRQPKLGPGDLHAVARRTLAMFNHLALRTRVELVLADSEEAMIVEMDDGQIQQALTNLVVNGIQAMPKGGHLRVALAREHVTPPVGVSALPGDYVRLSVADEGTGVRPEDLPRVFEPFFTTKEVGDGTGLGLSVSHGIVSEHGGWIAGASELGKGSTFSIFLPVAKGAAS